MVVTHIVHKACAYNGTPASVLHVQYSGRSVRKLIRGSRTVRQSLQQQSPLTQSGLFRRSIASLGFAAVTLRRFTAAPVQELRFCGLSVCLRSNQRSAPRRN